jgi:hypothetical protein
MSNIQLIPNSAELLQISTPSGAMMYQVISSATPSQRSVLAALNAPKVNAISDKDLTDLLIACVNKGLILLGHTRQWADSQDQATFIKELNLMIRENWSYYTAQEVKLVMELGVRGELKVKPDEVVFLNIEQVNRWFKVYRHENKPAAMAALKPYEPTHEAPEGFSIQNELQAFIARIQEGYDPTELEWITQSAQHYQWLDNEGLLGLSTEDKKAIYQEEKVLVIRKAKYNLEHVSVITKFVFGMFVNGQDASNSYEKETKTNCRIRAFRGYVQKQINQKAA